LIRLTNLENGTEGTTEPWMNIAAPIFVSEMLPSLDFHAPGLA